MDGRRTKDQGAGTTIIRTIDAHVEGGPLRLVIGGFPVPRGQTMIDKREWARRHADHLRRSLMLEPRGHADMCGAVLTEPTSPGSHAGVLFMDNDGYSDLSSHGIIAVTTIALERGLLMPGGDGATVMFDTTAGAIRARAAFRAGGGRPRPERRAGEAGTRSDSEREPSSAAEREDAKQPVAGSRAGEPGVRVERVSVLNAPSFVLHGGLAVRLGGRQIRADIAFGGAFHAIVDAETAGLPIDVAHASGLRHAGMEIRRAIEATLAVAHPLEPRLRGIHGTVFTGPSHEAGADLRTVGVFADAALDRSPSGTGTAAVMAVLDAIGLIGRDTPLVCEGLMGTRLIGRLVGRTAVGEHEAVVPEIEGSAWIIGEQTFFVDEADPLGEGFRV